MNNYRFSPIQEKSQLFAALDYIHTQCHEACKEVMGAYVPVAGNIGVFCHSQSEYVFLTNLRKELTDESVHWNHKYYRLLVPYNVSEKEDVPGATYTHLYVRAPDEAHAQVGDLDFFLPKKEYAQLKRAVHAGTGPAGLSVFPRQDVDLLVIDSKGRDVTVFINSHQLDT